MGRRRRRTFDARRRRRSRLARRGCALARDGSRLAINSRPADAIDDAPGNVARTLRHQPLDRLPVVVPRHNLRLRRRRRPRRAAAAGGPATPRFIRRRRGGRGAAIDCRAVGRRSHRALDAVTPVRRRPRFRRGNDLRLRLRLHLRLGTASGDPRSTGRSTGCRNRRSTGCATVDPSFVRVSIAARRDSAFQRSRSSGRRNTRRSGHFRRCGISARARRHDRSAAKDRKSVV